MVLIWKPSYSGVCGSPAGSQGGDERENVGQYVQAGSPAVVTYTR